MMTSQRRRYRPLESFGSARRSGGGADMVPCMQPVLTLRRVGDGRAAGRRLADLREALEALLQRRMTMELSMTIAIGAAAVIGELSPRS